MKSALVGNTGLGEAVYIGACILVPTKDLARCFYPNDGIPSSRGPWLPWSSLYLTISLALPRTFGQIRGSQGFKLHTEKAPALLQAPSLRQPWYFSLFLPNAISCVDAPTSFHQTSFITPMANSYLGCRGKALVRVMVITIVFPAYFLIGYNNAVAGALVSLNSFVAIFPQIDTVNTTGSKQAENARIQGLSDSPLAYVCPTRVLTFGYIGTIVSLYTVGCMFGSLGCLKFGDKAGRRLATMIGCVLLILGSVLLASSFSLGQLIVGRLVLGFGAGTISATVPVWQAESSPAEHRGALVVLEGFFAMIGLAMSQWIDLGMFFVQNSSSWRLPFAVPIIMGVIILGFAPFLPESPRWLMKHNRVEEAKSVLSSLDDLPEDDPKVVIQIQEMQQSLRVMSEGSFMGLFRNKTDKLIFRTLIAMYSVFGQQISGAGVVGFYTAVIFQQYVGMSPLVARILSGTLYTAQSPFALLPYFTIDRLGRRKTSMIGTIGMGLGFVILAAMTSQPNSRACSIVACVAVFIFGFSFSFGVLGVNYLYGTEVSPLAYRTPIYALTSITLWASSFLVAEVTPVGFATLGWKFFLFWAAFNLCLNLPGKFT